MNALPSNSPLRPRRVAGVAAARLLSFALPLEVIVFADSLPVLRGLSAAGLSLGYSVGVFAALVGEFGRLFPHLLGAHLAFVLAGLVCDLSHGSRRHTELASVFVVLVGVGVVGWSYFVLVSYHAFVGYWPFIAAAVVLAVYTVLGQLLSLVWRPRPKLALVVALWGGVCAAVALFLNATVFLHHYYELHLTLVAVAGILLQVSCFALISATRDPHRLPWALGIASVWFALLVLFSLAGTIWPLPSNLFPYLRTYSFLGLYHEAGPLERPCDDPPEDYSDARAQVAFEQFAHLQPLPANFELGDYNILLITVEATRYDATSFHAGQTTTPHLKAFAERGASVYHRAYSPSVATIQTMGSLLAMDFPSLLPFGIQQRDWASTLDLDEPSVAQLFTQDGRHTFQVTAEAPGYEPLQRGFQQQISGPFLPLNADDVLASKAIDAIDAAIKDSKTREDGSTTKFFGWTFFVSPHSPYSPRSQDDLSDHEIYLQEVSVADAAIGRVLEHLDERGLWNDTIVIVTADHGEEFREHGGTEHAAVTYEESAHVPLLIWLPGVSGGELFAPTSSLYVLPWLLQHGPGQAGELARRRIREDLAPLMERVEGAVLVEMLAAATCTPPSSTATTS